VIYFKYRKCTETTANLKMIENLIIPPDTSTAYGELCWVTWLQSGNFWIEAAIDCLRAFSDGMISVECRHTIFISYVRI